ncbi:MAG TPA: PAS domain S-box protein, partial [Ardenticatenaceae bacterium]
MQAVTTRQLRVLLVEDDEDDYILLRETLAEIRSTRYDLDWVQSYDEGLEALRRQAYDICLLDYRLGSRNGLELLQEPEVLESDTAFILLTGQGNRELDLEAMEAGAADYLVKGEISAALLERSIRYAVDHKRTVSMLRASEKHFRALIEHASDAISLLALDGSILYTSPSTAQILGYTPEEFVRLNAFELIHPDDIPYVTGLFQQLLQVPGSEVTVQYRLRHRDGSWRWMEGIGTNLLHEPSVQAIVTNYRNVTERKQAEEQLRFQSYLLNTVGQAVIATDIDGSILYWNHFAESLYGWSSSEVLGRNIVEVTPSEASKEQALELMARLRAGEGWSGEFLVRRRDGSSFPALVNDSPIKDENGQLVGIIGVSQDVTERKQAEEQLRFQAYLLNTVGQAVIATDMARTVL